MTLEAPWYRTHGWFGTISWFFRRRWRPPCWGLLCWSCRVVACCGCGWGQEHLPGLGLGCSDWGSGAADESGTEGSRRSGSGEGWWEAAWRAEDGTEQAAWVVSEHLEGGRCCWKRWTECLVQRCLENSLDLSETYKKGHQRTRDYTKNSTKPAGRLVTSII